MLYVSNEKTGNSVEEKRLLDNKLPVHQKLLCTYFSPPYCLPNVLGKWQLQNLRRLSLLKSFFYYFQYMVEIKHLVRGRTQNKIFNTHGKSNPSSPLHTAEAKRQGVLMTACCKDSSTETMSKWESVVSSRALLFHVGFAMLWQPSKPVKWAMCALKEAGHL